MKHIGFIFLKMYHCSFRKNLKFVTVNLIIAFRIGSYFKNELCISQP